jgi:hypothetical protein
MLILLCLFFRSKEEDLPGIKKGDKGASFRKYRPLIDTKPRDRAGSPNRPSDRKELLRDRKNGPQLPARYARVQQHLLERDRLRLDRKLSDLNRQLGEFANQDPSATPPNDHLALPLGTDSVPGAEINQTDSTRPERQRNPAQAIDPAEKLKAVQPKDKLNPIDPRLQFQPIDPRKKLKGRLNEIETFRKKLAPKKERPGRRETRVVKSRIGLLKVVGIGTAIMTTVMLFFIAFQGKNLGFCSSGHTREPVAFVPPVPML